MREDDSIRLQHMCEAAEKAVQFLGNKERSDLDHDQLLAMGLVKCIEIIGEAANKVSNECQISHPLIPWADIVAMRNHLIHGYFDINLEIVWKTVKDELPGLIEKLKKASTD